MSQRPTIQVAVVMRRERITGPASRWQTWRWVLADVVAHEESFGTVPRLLYKNENGESWLHPGYPVELYKDDAEGYHLNLTTPAPCFFVLWRLDESLETGQSVESLDTATEMVTEPMVKPVVVSLSYHDAGRWLDAQETVEQVAASQPVLEWLQAFVDEHHVVETKRRKRPESFRSLTDRFGNPVSISTEKKMGGNHG